jgi:hypothetical protein
VIINEEKTSNIKKEVPLVEAKCTIYETAILNLKRIYHLMELNNLLEGESAFDKLCVLSTNIIDFIIEYQGRQHYEPSQKFGGKKGFYQ